MAKKKEIISETVETKKKEKNLFRFGGFATGKNIVKNYKGKFAGQHYYDLDVSIAGKPEIKIVSAMKSRLTDEVGDDVLEDRIFGKHYVFICTRYGGKYRLRDLKELRVNVPFADDRKVEYIEAGEEPKKLAGKKTKKLK